MEGEKEESERCFETSHTLIREDFFEKFTRFLISWTYIP